METSWRTQDMSQNKTSIWDCNILTLLQSHHQTEWLCNKVEILVSYTCFVLTHILSSPRCLYFLEYVLFYIFLSCSLVKVSAESPADILTLTWLHALVCKGRVTPPQTAAEKQKGWQVRNGLLLQTMTTASPGHFSLKCQAFAWQFYSWQQSNSKFSVHGPKLGIALKFCYPGTFSFYYQTVIRANIDSHKVTGQT